MSVTSSSVFFVGSVLFDQEKYWSLVSASIEPNPETIDEEFKKPLKDRISGPIHTTGRYAHYHLDDVDVRVPSDAFRQYQVDQWAQAKKAAEDSRWRWSAVAISALLVDAIGLGLIATVAKS